MSVVSCSQVGGPLISLRFAEPGRGRPTAAGWTVAAAPLPFWRPGPGLACAATARWPGRAARADALDRFCGRLFPLVRADLVRAIMRSRSFFSSLAQLTRSAHSLSSLAQLTRSAHSLSSLVQ